MKQTIIFLALTATLAVVEAAKAKVKEDATNLKADDDLPKAGELGSVMTPAFLTGLITTFFLYWMVSFGIGQLMDIQVPPYQLKYDDKNKDNNRDWSRIWGNLEK